ISEDRARPTTSRLDAVASSLIAEAIAVAGSGRNSIARRMSPTAVIEWTDDPVAEVAQRLRDTEVDLEDVRLIPVLTLDRRIVGTLDALELLRFAPGTGVAGLAEPIEEITHTDDDM